MLLDFLLYCIASTEDELRRKRDFCHRGTEDDYFFLAKTQRSKGLPAASNRGWQVTQMSTDAKVFVFVIPTKEVSQKIFLMLLVSLLCCFASTEDWLRRTSFCSRPARAENPIPAHLLDFISRSLVVCLIFIRIKHMAINYSCWCCVGMFLNFSYCHNM